MAKNSKIEWTDHTLNFWIGCQEVSPACDHCYARENNKRFKWVDGWGAHGERRRTSVGNWHQLYGWNAAAKKSGYRYKVFCNSLSDFFDNRAPAVWRREAWHFIEQCPDLDFLILTKRPENILKMLPDPESGTKQWGAGWPNVWLGTTVENRKEGIRRAWALAQIPAVHRFWSCEPLLEDLGDLTGLCLRDTAADGRPAVSWVITGGESGQNARPSNPQWFRDIRDQCISAGVSYFHKQNGEFAPVTEIDLTAAYYTFRDGETVRRVGKKTAGRLLDGVEWSEKPYG